MIKALLIDDEPANTEALAELIKTSCPGIRICGQAASVNEAERLTEELSPQLLFLDVEMPDGSGFDLLDRLKDRRMEVIFVTAYDSFMLKAIRYSALDYITKPVSIPELMAAVARAEERIGHTSVNSQLELLLQNIKSPAHVQRIAVPYKDEYLFVPVSDIERLEAKGAYTELFVKGGKGYLVSKNIKEYEELLPKSTFCRVHHAHIINIDYVRAYHKGRGGYLEMADGTSIEVSVRRKEEFLARFR
jgi:two-component system LytT family response regulator